MCWDKKKRTLVSVQASFLTETILNVIENKSIRRNYQPDSYSHCRLFAPLQQYERSWSMAQLFLHFHYGAVYWHGAQKYLYECRICLSEQWKSALCDCWALCFDLFGLLLRGKLGSGPRVGQGVQKWNVKYLISGSFVWMVIGCKQSGLSNPGKSKWSLGCVLGQMMSSQLAAFDSPTLAWCCSSHWAT